MRLRLANKVNQFYGKGSLFLSGPSLDIVRDSFLVELVAGSSWDAVAEAFTETFNVEYLSDLTVGGDFEATVSAFEASFLSDVDVDNEISATVDAIVSSFESDTAVDEEFGATSQAPGGPTKLYFHQADYAGGGTMPSGTQSGITADFTANNITVINTLNTTIGVADPHVGNLATTLANTNVQKGYHGMFASQPLASAQNVGGGNITLLVAENDAANANFWINGMEVYVWRPSTGTKIGTIKAFNSTSLGGTKPTNASSYQTTYITGISSSEVAAQTGDLIICEIWSIHTQSQAATKNVRFWFDGTTEESAENVIVTSCASYIQFAESLTFS